MGGTLLQVVETATPDEFLDAIAPRGPYLRGYARPRRPRDLIFRGHADDRQKLVPSAFRGNLRRLTSLEGTTPEAQLRAEIEALADFFWTCDLSGLALPEDTQEMRLLVDEIRTPRFLDRVLGGEVAWPPDGLLSILALAQHYGLSTRLLDWSRSELVAAYFAALGAATASRPPCPGCGAQPADGQDADTPRRLAVWAFSLGAFTRDDPDEPPRGRRPVQLVTAPGASIPNLRAQQGLFSVYRPTDGRDVAYLNDARPLDAILGEVLGPPEPAALPTLLQFTLPARLAPALLFLLAQHGINGASLFPGYDGVVKSLFERELWEAS